MLVKLRGMFRQEVSVTFQVFCEFLMFYSFLLKLYLPWNTIHIHILENYSPAHCCGHFSCFMDLCGYLEEIGWLENSKQTLSWPSPCHELLWISHVMIISDSHFLMAYVKWIGVLSAVRMNWHMDICHRPLMRVTVIYTNVHLQHRFFTKEPLVSFFCLHFLYAKWEGLPCLQAIQVQSRIRKGHHRKL